MVDDIRVRGCGKSGIKSVYKAKMGTGQAKPVTVHGLSYAHTQLNILYTCKHTGTLLLHLVQAYIEFPSRPFTNIFCHEKVITENGYLVAILSLVLLCRWPSVTLRKVTWTPVCICGRSCHVVTTSRDQPSSLTKTGRHFPFSAFTSFFK